MHHITNQSQTGLFHQSKHVLQIKGLNQEAKVIKPLIYEILKDKNKIYSFEIFEAQYLARNTNVVTDIVLFR